MEMIVNFLHVFTELIPTWFIPLSGLVASILLYLKTKKYSVIVMIVGFGIYFIAWLYGRFPKLETVKVSASDVEGVADSVSLSVNQMTPFYEMMSSLSLPGITIASIGLLIFSITFKPAPNKSLKKDATNVAPIS